MMNLFLLIILLVLLFIMSVGTYRWIRTFADVYKIVKNVDIETKRLQVLSERKNDLLNRK